jgi:hypothetical protein
LARVLIEICFFFGSHGVGSVFANDIGSEMVIVEYETDFDIFYSINPSHNINEWTQKETAYNQTISGLAWIVEVGLHSSLAFKTIFVIFRARLNCLKSVK